MMTFADFVIAVDERLRDRISAAYGLYQGPHVAFWQFGAATARVREGSNADAGLMLVGDDDVSPERHGACDTETVAHFADAIADRFAAEIGV
jgi:hypothetical protein